VNPYVNWLATAHGIDADEVQLRRDELHGALYIELSGNERMSIRIQLTPHAAEDPEQHTADLKRDREGMRRLSEVARLAAEEIGQLVDDGAGQTTGPGEDSQRLREIRSLLARFDWEHDDRQLALEAIERIVDSDQADELAEDQR
jgi:hypothetical protein